MVFRRDMYVKTALFDYSVLSVDHSVLCSQCFWGKVISWVFMGNDAQWILIGNRASWGIVTSWILTWIGLPGNYPDMTARLNPSLEAANLKRNFVINNNSRSCLTVKFPVRLRVVKSDGFVDLGHISISLDSLESSTFSPFLVVSASPGIS